MAISFRRTAATNTLVIHHVLLVVGDRLALSHDLQNLPHCYSAVTTKHHHDGHGRFCSIDFQHLRPQRRTLWDDLRRQVGDGSVQRTDDRLVGSRAWKTSLRGTLSAAKGGQGQQCDHKQGISYFGTHRSPPNFRNAHRACGSEGWVERTIDARHGFASGVSRAGRGHYLLRVMLMN